MQHTNYPNKSSWNPTSRNGIEPCGVVSASNYGGPFMRAAVWNPEDGLTAVYDTPNTYAYLDVSTRKQGGWIAAVPANTAGLVLLPFNKESGFGDKTIIGTNYGQFVAAKFSSDGDILIAITSSKLYVWRFNKSGLQQEITETVPPTRLVSLQGLDVSYSLQTFIITGIGTAMLELRSFNNLSDEGRLNDFNMGGPGFTKLSGVFSNGKRYWAYSPNNVSRCYFGQIDNRSVLSWDGYIETNTNRNYPSFCPMFVEELDSLTLGQATDSRSNDFANGGVDYFMYQLPSGGTPAGGALIGPSYDGNTLTSLGNAWSATTTNGGDGGGVIATLRPPGWDVAISGLNYGWNNQRAIDVRKTFDMGFSTALTAWAAGVGVTELDWF